MKKRWVPGVELWTVGGKGGFGGRMLVKLSFRGSLSVGISFWKKKSSQFILSVGKKL